MNKQQIRLARAGATGGRRRPPNVTDQAEKIDRGDATRSSSLWRPSSRRQPFCSPQPRALASPAARPGATQATSGVDVGLRTLLYDRCRRRTRRRRSSAGRARDPPGHGRRRRPGHRHRAAAPGPVPGRQHHQDIRGHRGPPARRGGTPRPRRAGGTLAAPLAGRREQHLQHQLHRRRLLVEAVTHHPLSRELQQRIFEPLRLEDTSFPSPRRTYEAITPTGTSRPQTAHRST
jgi:hypothetical protein